jgi:hypothetical protein
LHKIANYFQFGVLTVVDGLTLYENDKAYLVEFYLNNESKEWVMMILQQELQIIIETKLVK